MHMRRRDCPQKGAVAARLAEREARKDGVDPGMRLGCRGPHRGTWVHWTCCVADIGFSIKTASRYFVPGPGDAAG
jgi:hypothetical protein